MDIYDKMAEFLLGNNMDDCRFCSAIKMKGNNSCCDNEAWCKKGIAEYLRRKKVLQLNEQ